MNKRAVVMILLICCALVTMAQSPSCTPPMNATGNYTGTWSYNVLDNGTVVDTIDCPLNMILEQKTDKEGAASYSVNGTIQVDFSCFAESSDWPQWAEVPETTDIKVGGTMEDSGKLYLVSGGCGPGTCIVLILDGQGKTEMMVTDNDSHNFDAAEYGEWGIYENMPFMKYYSGKWGIGIGIAFLGNAAAGGDFAVEREN